MKLLTETNFQFKNQKSLYKGKVRDVYELENGLLIMIASDRISAFDVILPKAIPYKGQVLNRMASFFLKQSEHICKNWLISSPHPNVSIGLKLEPIKVEVVVRGYLAGHAWREYSLGKRQVCGETLPEGLIENQKLPKPIITPTTKASEGHDLDISAQEIVDTNLVNASDWKDICQLAFSLFENGTQLAAKNGLILVDTKYEFGKNSDGEIMLMDEIHTPDSSRYFHSDVYEVNQQNGKPQEQLSKEFVRQWLIQNNFSGKEGEVIPTMTDEFVTEVSDKYCYLLQKLTGLEVERYSYELILDEISNSINQEINNIS